MDRAGGGGFKKARAAIGGGASIDRCMDLIGSDRDRRSHSKSLIRKWLDCPLEQGLKDALRRDLEEIYEEDEIGDEWVDRDETVFGSNLPVKNPFEELDVEEISARLPNASYVKAGTVKIEDKEGDEGRIF